jgi:hypothetical protein
MNTTDNSATSIGKPRLRRRSTLWKMDTAAANLSLPAGAPPPMRPAAGAKLDEFWYQRSMDNANTLVAGAEGVDSARFDVLDYSEEQLVSVVGDIFARAGLAGSTGGTLFDARSFEAVVCDIRHTYDSCAANRGSPSYHGWVHAVDVLQMTFVLLTGANLAPLYLSQRSVFALLFAALCHDMGHGGWTNAMLVNTADPLVAEFGGDATLERYHAKLCADVLDRHAVTLLGRLPAPAHASVHATVRSLILATDMGRNGSIAERVRGRFLAPAPSDTDTTAGTTTAGTTTAGAPSSSQNARPSDESPGAGADIGACGAGGGAESGGGNGGGSSRLRPGMDGDDLASGGGDPAGASASDALLLMQWLLKCADISNVARPFASSRAWAARLADEFCAQGDVERARGLPVSSLCDRGSCSVPKMSAGFIQFVALGAFRQLEAVLPCGATRAAVCQVERNAQRWQQAIGAAAVAAVATATPSHGAAGREAGREAGQQVAAVAAAAAAPAAGAEAGAEAEAEVEAEVEVEAPRPRPVLAAVAAPQRPPLPARKQRRSSLPSLPSFAAGSFAAAPGAGAHAATATAAAATLSVADASSQGPKQQPAVAVAAMVSKPRRRSCPAQLMHANIQVALQQLAAPAPAPSPLAA